MPCSNDLVESNYPYPDSLPRVGLDCEKRSGLCSKLPDVHSVGDVALNFDVHFHYIDNAFTVCVSAY